MIKNYFSVAWRSILKRKTFTAINILGISIGISFALLATLFVGDELSFDKTHLHRDLIFRMDNIPFHNGVPDLASRGRTFPMPFAPTVKTSIPGIDFATRFDERTGFVKTQQLQFREKISYIDADFLKMFTVDFIAGNGDKFISNDKSILLSQDKAIKLFGSTDVIGNSLEIGEASYTVDGVFHQLPRNSSFDFEILSRFENFPGYRQQGDDWKAWSGSAFVMLSPSVRIGEVEDRLNQFSKEHLAMHGTESIGIILTSLSKIHFDNQVEWVNVSNVKYSYVLSGIAVAVLCVACANYVMLSLAGSMSRVREIGIRKVMGATQQMVRTQFFGESVLMVIFSLPLSFLILRFVLPEFNYFMGREISLTGAGYVGLMSIAGILLLTGLMAGGYPAIILSRLTPERVLNSHGSGGNRSRFSGLLVVFQFIACFLLLICSLMMFKQMKMIHARDLGFNREQIVIVEATNDHNIDGRRVLRLFRSELQNDKDVISLSGMKSDFGIIPMSMSFQDSTGKQISNYFVSVDYDFFEMLGIALVEGRYFSRSFPADTLGRFVVNESFLRQLRVTTLVGKSLPIAPGSEVVGIVKDFNFESLEHQVKPMVFMMGRPVEKMFIKINPGDIPSTLIKLEKTWQKVVGNEAFRFTFLSDHLNKQYHRYTQWIRIVTISAFIAIVIACLGLIGIINLAVINRTREIGIRKVFGASVTSIVFLFSRYYMRLILFGFTLSAPLSWYLSSQWLQNFAYQTRINWVIFIAPLVFILVLALTVMASQIFRKARLNPVESIRHE